MSDDLTKDFRAVTLSGRLMLTGHDGRTCEIDISELHLDRMIDPEQRFTFSIDEQNDWTTHYGRHFVTNRLSKLHLTAELSPGGQPETYYTMTFKAAPEPIGHCVYDDLGNCQVKSHYEVKA